MRLLIVEDDAALRALTAQRLRDQGYVVDEAANGVEGEYLGAEYPVDLAIVDLGLPDKSGLAVIASWRRRGRGFPILILTARSRWEDKVEGLEAGADDYLVKPFQFEELLARLRALVRRASGWSDPRLRFDPVVLDTSAKRVELDGAHVALTALEYRVLEYLMLHAGSVVAKNTLSEHVYDDAVESDSNVLEVIVARLRRKLDPDRALNPIETIRGHGYRFRLPRTAGGAASGAS